MVLSSESLNCQYVFFISSLKNAVQFHTPIYRRASYTSSFVLFCFDLHFRGLMIREFYLLLDQQEVQVQNNFSSFLTLTLQQECCAILRHIGIITSGRNILSM